jgi:peroxiredoxin
LRRLVEFYPELKVGYARIVTISTDNLLETNEFRGALGAEWPFLSDPRRVVQQDLQIQEYTDPHHDPLIPYTLVLEPELVIYKIYNGYWYFGRPSVAELYQDLRKVTRKHAPDWYLAAEGLREAWDAEERDSFFPYGLSRRELLRAEG